jgi:tetratricopeptide (TPR) repeat protein
MKGMCKEALAEATLANDGWTFAKCGEPKKAREILSNLLAKRKKGYVDASDLAVIYLALGNKEKAFEWLEKAVQEHAEEMNWLKCAFHWDPIRSDPRFLDLLRRVGFPP